MSCTSPRMVMATLDFINSKYAPLKCAELSQTLQVESDRGIMASPETIKAERDGIQWAIELVESQYGEPK